MNKSVILFLLGFSLSACSNAFKVDESIIKCYYEIMELSETQYNESKLIHKADSLLQHIKSDTSAYKIGLHSIQGHLYARINDSTTSKLHYNTALSLLTKKMSLQKSINLNDALNRAYILCFMGKKSEAVEYIESINFSEEQLSELGDVTPCMLIKSFNK